MLIDTYLPTIGFDWVEVRAISTAAAVQMRLDGQPSVRLEPACRDQRLHYFRHRFAGLDAGSSGVIEVQANGESAVLPFRTLVPPAGQRRLRLGLLPDLHIQPHGRTQAITPGTRRLYGVAEELAFRYLRRLADQDADLVIFVGDTLDPLDDYTRTVAKDLLQSVDIPCQLLIGNHECYGPYDEPDFNRVFGLPAQGFHSTVVNGLALIFLSTPHQGSLQPGGSQYRWLTQQLNEYANRLDTFVFAHFSLLLHPCNAGAKNDGMQQLYHYDRVLNLFKGYRRLRAYIAGHKNVPSRVVHQQVLHLLSPQLIQAPCAYSVIDVYEQALVHNVYEIEEQHYLQISRDTFGDAYGERYGEERCRHYVYPFP